MENRQLPKKDILILTIVEVRASSLYRGKWVRSLKKVVTLWVCLKLRISWILWKIGWEERSTRKSKWGRMPRCSLSMQSGKSLLLIGMLKPGWKLKETIVSTNSSIPTIQQLIDTPLNENQVFTSKYRKLIYEEVKKDKKDFPLMNQFLKNGVMPKTEVDDPL